MKENASRNELNQVNLSINAFSVQQQQYFPLCVVNSKKLCLFHCSDRGAFNYHILSPNKLYGNFSCVRRLDLCVRGAFTNLEFLLCTQN